MSFHSFVSMEKTGMDNKKQKEFIVPEAIIIAFDDEDIITYSNRGEYPNEWIGEPW